VHIPRRYYTEVLPGIPTIRPFEALACGIPLVSAPWPDREHLFQPGFDYLVARNGLEMKEHLAGLLGRPEHANELVHRGLARIRSAHTCRHRVDELLSIVRSLASDQAAAAAAVTGESPPAGGIREPFTS
jgi:spore maturation protein CgeB